MNMQAPLQLAAILMPDGCLVVNPLGDIPVVVTYSGVTEKTATIAFGGVNQALVTFDEQGVRPLTYMLYNCAPDMALDQSVQNIIAYLTEAPTLLH